MIEDHKSVHRYHEPGNAHEFTFSCHRREPLLIDPAWNAWLAEAVDRANTAQSARLVAFVFMPEHVHLLVLPMVADFDVPRYLKAVKRPFAFRVKRALAERGDPMLERRMVCERPGVVRFRFWQEGGGYDRNMMTMKAVRAAIAYIHANPVRRGLCERPTDWQWSSARIHDTPEKPVEPSLPRVEAIPPHFFRE